MSHPPHDHDHLEEGSPTRDFTNTEQALVREIWSILEAAGWSSDEIGRWWITPCGYLPDRTPPHVAFRDDPYRVHWVACQEAKEFSG